MVTELALQRLFRQPFATYNAELTVNAMPAAVLTEAGRVVRLAALGDVSQDVLDYPYVAPLTAYRFRSVMSEWDTRLAVQSIAVKDPGAERVISRLLEFYERQIKRFEFRGFSSYPNIHERVMINRDDQVWLSSWIEETPVAVRDALVSLLAPLLWSVAHRPNHNDFIIFDCLKPWESGGESLGYVQFKGCGGHLDPLGQRWLFGESTSADQKDCNGTRRSPRHARYARLLGWRQQDRHANDHGLFLMGQAVQAALLAEMVVDTFICLHGLEAGGRL